ncbi:hypothetical protein DLREEDagr8_18720 [Dongia sp. agr-C8]
MKESDGISRPKVGRFDWRRIMEPIFLAAVFAIMWLSSSLLADDLESLRAAELRLARCPAHA